MPGSSPYQGSRTNVRPTSAPASVRVPSSPYRRRNAPTRTRSASPRRAARPASSPRPGSAPSRVRYSPAKLPKKPSTRSKKKGSGFMRRLVTGLAILSGASLTRGPRNQVRMGGNANRPQETRMMPYTGHRHVVFAAPGVYNVPSLPIRVINEPLVRSGNISSLERKLLPGRVIGVNAARAKPVYLREGKAGPILVGFQPGISPEQARVLISRGYKFSNRNLQSQVMHGRLINPNAGSLNNRTKQMLTRAQLNGKTGLNAYPASLQTRIRGMTKKIVGFGAIVPQGPPKALAK